MSLKNKIKFLPEEEIKKAADDLLCKAYKAGIYDFNSPTPLDLIAEDILDLKIMFHDLEKDHKGVLGALDLQNSIIWLDNSLDHTQTGQFVDEGRCNFTIAHEIGHNILHGNVILDGGLIAFHNELNPNTKNAETQANMFAAMFAMPRKLVFKKWNEDFAYIESYNDTITAMTDFFRVSRESMQFRLKDLRLLNISNY
jgi:Zn-dependent peptidase ImmA (M78 family)